VRGIHRMLEEERECSEVIRQVVAAGRALDQVGVLIVNESLRNCIGKSAVSGEDPGAAFDEAVSILFAAAKHKS